MKITHIFFLIVSFGSISCLNDNLVDKPKEVKENESKTFITETKTTEVDSVKSYDEFLLLFEKENSLYRTNDGHKNEIPYHIISRYLNIEINQDYYSAIFADSIWKKSSHIVLFLSKECLGGGECIESNMVTVNHKGEAMSEIVIEAMFTGNEEGDVFSSVFTKDTINVYQKRYKFSESGDTLLLHTTKKEFLYNDSGNISFLR